MRSRRSGIVIAIVSLAAMAFLYAPLLAIVAQSFNASPRGTEWQGFTLRWYHAAMNSSTVLSAARVTLLLALASTAIATILGTALGLGLSRSRVPFRRTMEASLLGPIMVPDILMAVALLLLFHQVRHYWHWLQPGLLTMTLGHVTFQIPFVALIVRARLAGFDASLEEAARDLGATAWQSFWRVKLPLIWPGIGAGALLAFTLSLDDFVVSFFTTGPGASTLPILIYASVKRGITPEINAVSTLFIAAAFAASLLIALLKPGAERQRG